MKLLPSLKLNQRYIAFDIISDKKFTVQEIETAVMSAIKRVSKPGQRIYVGASKIKSVKNGYGLSIISTPKGLMTNKEARKAGLGGEILLEIW